MLMSREIGQFIISLALLDTNSLVRYRHKLSQLSHSEFQKVTLVMFYNKTETRVYLYSYLIPRCCHASHLHAVFPALYRRSETANNSKH